MAGLVKLRQVRTDAVSRARLNRFTLYQPGERTIGLTMMRCGRSISAMCRRTAAVDERGRLAEAIDGKVAFLAEGNSSYARLDAKSAPRIEHLLSAHPEAWRQAIEALIAEIAEARTTEAP